MGSKNRYALRCYSSVVSLGQVISDVLLESRQFNGVTSLADVSEHPGFHEAFLVFEA